MTCLTYLLDLLERGHEFTILYDGDHCIGVNKNKLFEIGSQFKEELLNGKNVKAVYLPLEKSLSFESVCRMFNLAVKESEILKRYYSK